MNCKGQFSERLQFGDSQCVDAGKRRKLILQRLQEAARRQIGCLGFNDNAVRRVVDKTGNAEFRRDPVDERPKSDALDYALNVNSLAGDCAQVSSC